MKKLWFDSVCYDSFGCVDTVKDLSIDDILGIEPLLSLLIFDGLGVELYHSLLLFPLRLYHLLNIWLLIPHTNVRWPVYRLLVYKLLSFLAYQTRDLAHNMIRLFRHFYGLECSSVSVSSHRHFDELTTSCIRIISKSLLTYLFEILQEFEDSFVISNLLLGNVALQFIVETVTFVRLRCKCQIEISVFPWSATWFNKVFP